MIDKEFLCKIEEIAGCRPLLQNDYIPFGIEET